MSNTMASHIGDNPQGQSSTNEKGKGIMNEDMEGAMHLQDSAIRILWEEVKNVKKLSSEACIFKVHEMLRKTNPEAYTPLTISIGPYHHGKPELRKMERLKELYTQSLLNDAEGVGVEECWKILKDLEGKAKKYYGDEIEEEVSGDEFVKMLLLDGCFILEFVRRKPGEGQEYNDNDPIYMMISGMESHILRDMLLLENQLPFFVLQELHDMIFNEPDKSKFSKKVKTAFRSKIPKCTFSGNLDPKHVKHLLHIVHIFWQPRPQNNGQTVPQGLGEGQGGSNIESQSHPSNGQDRQPQQSTDDDEDLLCTIRTASELQEAGVHFKKLGNIRNTNSDQTISLFDIKFNHSVLKIPSFALYDSTETLFRNFIAYEQHSHVHPKYFTDYSKFMSELINTEKDVNLLRLEGVFVNGLGDDNAVACLFNNLNKGVIYHSNNFYYRDVCTKLNRHCKKTWNRWMATLRHDYFHSPWAGISTFVAILFLLLAIAQIVLSALKLHK